MTSAARTNKRSGGFTLLEVIIVLAIAAIVMGGAVGLVIYSSDERALRETSGDIELLAKRARTVAILRQTPYALEFRENIVRLLPLAQAGQPAPRASRSRGAAVPAESGEDGRIALEGNMELALRRWNSEEWLGTGKGAIHIWRFDPDGLCEPLSVRLTLERSWSEDVYHPLTATIRESQLEAR